MKPSDKLRDADALETYRLILAKATSHPKIKSALAMLGYNMEKLKEGNELLKSAREIYEENIRKKDALAFGSAAYTRKKEEIEQGFRLQRNKALILARKDPEIAMWLSIDGPYPRRRTLWMDSVKSFYSEAAGNPEIQEKLMLLRLTKKEIEEGLTDIGELENLYAEYMYLKGESQQSTIDKNKAFKKMHEWIKEFFLVARIALKKNPELLEALKKSV